MFTQAPTLNKPYETLVENLYDDLLRLLSSVQGPSSWPIDEQLGWRRRSRRLPG